MNKVILDSSALLALINEEKGADIVETLIGRIVMSSVNVAEVASKIYDTLELFDEEKAKISIEPFVNTIVDFDKSISFISAAIRAQTHNKSLSLGDRACIATGICLNMDIYTADKAWTELNIPNVKIHLIR